MERRKWKEMVWNGLCFVSNECREWNGVEWIREGKVDRHHLICIYKDACSLSPLPYLTL